MRRRVQGQVYNVFLDRHRNPGKVTNQVHSLIYLQLDNQVVAQVRDQIHILVYWQIVEDSHE